MHYYSQHAIERMAHRIGWVGTLPRPKDCDLIGSFVHRVDGTEEEVRGLPHRAGLLICKRAPAERDFTVVTAIHWERVEVRGPVALQEDLFAASLVWRGLGLDPAEIRRAFAGAEVVDAFPTDATEGMRRIGAGISCGPCHTMGVNAGRPRWWTSWIHRSRLAFCPRDTSTWTPSVSTEAGTPEPVSRPPCEETWADRGSYIGRLARFQGALWRMGEGHEWVRVRKSDDV